MPTYHKRASREIGQFEECWEILRDNEVIAHVGSCVLADAVLSLLADKPELGEGLVRQHAERRAPDVNLPLDERMREVAVETLRAKERQYFVGQVGFTWLGKREYGVYVNILGEWERVYKRTLFDCVGLGLVGSSEWLEKLVQRIKSGEVSFISPTVIMAGYTDG